MDTCRKNERIETYSEFVERSTDFIDEPKTPLSETKSITAFVDQYGYTEIPEFDSKDSFSLTSDSLNSNCTTMKEQLKNKHSRQNIDTADGICYYRQVTQDNLSQIDNKPRSLEKDKLHERGVVNRAMMVARSMGLHGNLSKSSNSPKSTRKPNTIFASE